MCQSNCGDPENEDTPAPPSPPPVPRPELTYEERFQEECFQLKYHEYPLEGTGGLVDLARSCRASGYTTRVGVLDVQANNSFLDWHDGQHFLNLYDEVRTQHQPELRDLMSSPERSWLENPSTEQLLEDGTFVLTAALCIAPVPNPWCYGAALLHFAAGLNVIRVSDDPSWTDVALLALETYAATLPGLATASYESAAIVAGAKISMRELVFLRAAAETPSLALYTASRIP